MKLFRGGLVFKAHRLLYPSTLGLRVIQKKKKKKKKNHGRHLLQDPQPYRVTLYTRLLICAEAGGIRQDRNVKRFRGGLVFKAHRLLNHSTLGLSVIKKKKKCREKGDPLG